MSRSRVLLTTAVLGISIGPLVAAALPNVIVGRTARPETQLLAGRSETAQIMFEAPDAPPPEEAVTTTTATTAAPHSVVKPAVRRVQPAGDAKNAKNKPDTRPKPKPSGLPLGTPFVGRYDGPEIEGYARYDAQSTCDPSAKPGAIALRDLLLGRYANTSSLGIGRSCDTEGVSEHEEGRAFDWGANVGNAAQRAAVDDFLGALFATDSYGHPHALARRMGIMYVIWNHQIWGAYQASAGWRPYDGSNPHTDHVHISLSWAGARAETSFWSGHVVPGLPDGTHTTIPRGSTSTTRRDRPPRSTTTSVVLTTTTTLRGSTTTTTAAPAGTSAPTTSTTRWPPRRG
jgi:hypothetical protein